MISRDLSTARILPSRAGPGRPRWSRPFLSIVVPAYNEETRIRSCIDRLRTALPDLVPSWEIVVVDDGSGDKTREVVSALAAEDDRIRLLALPHRGKGEAVKRGLLEARGEWRFMADADLATPPDNLPRFLEHTSDAAHGAGDRIPGGARRPAARRALDPSRHRARLQLVRPRLHRQRHQRHAVRLQAAQRRRRRGDLSVPDDRRLRVRRGDAGARRSCGAVDPRGRRHVGRAIRKVEWPSDAERRRSSTSSASAGVSGAARIRRSHGPPAWRVRLKPDTTSSSAWARSAFGRGRTCSRSRAPPPWRTTCSACRCRCSTRSRRCWPRSARRRSWTPSGRPRTTPPISGRSASSRSKLIFDAAQGHYWLAFRGLHAATMVVLPAAVHARASRAHRRRSVRGGVRAHRRHGTAHLPQHRAGGVSDQSLSRDRRARAGHAEPVAGATETYRRSRRAGDVRRRGVDARVRTARVGGRRDRVGARHAWRLDARRRRP